MAAILEMPRPSAIPQVLQDELESILVLKAQVQKMNSELAEKTESVKALLQAGAVVENGTRMASLKDNGRRSVAWREKVEELADRLYGEGRGKGYADNVMKNTKKSESWTVEVL